jgi:hypothetical protein
MTTQTNELPHDPYIAAVLAALTAAGLEPDSSWTSGAETDPWGDGCQMMLNAILVWEGGHQALNGNQLPDGITLIWEHPAQQWQWGERGPHGVLKQLPEFLPTLGLYSDPAAVVNVVRALLADQPVPEGHAPYWHLADPVKTAVEAWAATDTEDEGPQPCGESGCICYHQGHPDHADCACGCDCPRYTNDIDQSVIVGAE